MMSILGLCGVAWMFVTIGILRLYRASDLDVPLDRGEYVTALAVAFLWPVWVPIAIAAVLVVLLVNGIWEVL